MTALEVIDLAWQDKQPGPMTTAEELLWYQARVMFLEYKAGKLPADVGKNLKQKYIAEFNRLSTQLEMSDRILKENAERYIKIAPMIDSYRLEPSLKKADEIVNTFYGLTGGNK